MQVIPLQVLVVDDEVDAAESMVELLQMDGHTAEMVHTGHDALDAARRIRRDVVLMDIGLPGMYGYQVATLIRREVTLDPTLLVALTGWGNDEDKRAALGAGFDLHLLKPVSLDVLREVLGQVRQRSRSG